MKPIPLIQISGSHFEAGRQLGAATTAMLRRLPDPPAGRTWEEMRELARPYLAATQAVIPWLHTEMEGTRHETAVGWMCWICMPAPLRRFGKVLPL
ncbi:MAG: hypothetical protein U0401_10105 [Anaerolineae bacterium]